MTTKEAGERLGLAGFVIGIISVAMIPFFAVLIFLGPSITAILFGIIGLVFAMVQKKKKKTRLARIGIILNLIGIILGIVSLIILVYLLMPILTEQAQNLGASFPSA